jgi:arylsulfatase A-like enzyme
LPPPPAAAAIVGCYDIYPTVLDLAGIPLPPQQKIDGISCRRAEKHRNLAARRLFHLVPAPGSWRQCPPGDWKLIRRFTERPGEYEGVHELFNLKEDLGETTNLARQMPEKVKALDALIDSFVRDTCALPETESGLQTTACKAAAGWCRA